LPRKAFRPGSSEEDGARADRRCAQPKPRDDAIEREIGAQAGPEARIRPKTLDAMSRRRIGPVTLGTGFVFNSRFSINPIISIPVGLDGSSTSFGLVGAMNFGR
jgi:hypothetical protein